MRHPAANKHYAGSTNTLGNQQQQTGACLAGPKRAAGSAVAGKQVVLAAMVHQFESGGAAASACEASEQATTHTRAEANVARKSIRGKLSKFFSRKQTNSQLIDNAGAPEKRSKQPNETGGGSFELQARAPAEINPGAPLDGLAGEQVIEFKFDLIVEDGFKANGYSGAGDESTTIGGKLEANVNQLVDSFVLDSSDVCLMSTGKERVLAPGGTSEQTFHQRRQLLEAGEFEFVLKLAAQSLGRSFELLKSLKGDQASQLKKLEPPGELGSVDFNLPDLTRERNSNSNSNQTPQPNANANATRLANHSSDSADYSIELGATLFLSTRRRRSQASPPTQASQEEEEEEGNQYEIFDLLSSDNNLNGDRKTRSDDREVGADRSPTDCGTLEQGLRVLAEVRRKLARLQTSAPLNHSNDLTLQGSGTGSRRLLLIGMKLKRRINGGLFSNRLSLIDFDPNFSELTHLLESIFNGQALAYLRKRHKSINCNATGELFQAGSNTKQQQHHQVASERKKLYQAEWSLYKQLSSALIRALLIVHVHKLSPPEAGAGQELRCGGEIGQGIVPRTPEAAKKQPYYEQLLMEENLRLLEFAKTIQRASNVRLRRRKRHLRSHLAMASSNASVASNASANTTLLQKLHHQHRPEQLQGDCSLAHNFRQRADERFHTIKSATSGRQRKWTQQQQQFRQQASGQRRHRSGCAGRESRRQPHSRQPRQSFDYLTESSSMSTSTSGSQETEGTTRRMQSVADSSSAGRQLRPEAKGAASRQQVEETNFNGVNFYSDTDSVASVNFNSCSSSSFNRLTALTCSSSSPSAALQLQAKSRQRRDIELKWLSKQKNNSSHYAPNSQDIELSSYNSMSASASGQQQQRRRRSSPLQFNNQPDVNLDSRRRRRESSSSSSIIQIDCQSPLAVRPTRPQEVEHSDEGFLQIDQTDNASDICSIVAEPPKQLKLEEFLNQFSTIIASPIKPASRPAESVSGEVSSSLANQLQTSTTTNQEEAAFLAGMRRPECAGADTSTNAGDKSQTLSLPDEDDEDCKSHSSILEHLASLALESNSKLLQNRSLNATIEPLPPTGQTPNGFDYEPDYTILERPVVLEPTNGLASSKIPTSGHLQRLLNCSTQLIKRPAGIASPSKPADSRVALLTLAKGQPARTGRSSLEEQLQALSISCLAAANDQATLSSPSTSSGAFASDSNSCSSSLSPAAGASEPARTQIRSELANQEPGAYASVSRRPNVKT